MAPLLWFLCGSATTLATTLLLVARARKRRDALVRAQLAELEVRANEPKVEHRTVVIGETKSLDQLARSVGSELATLASGVEGHAQLLCEGIGDPTLVAQRAERLWSATRRVRLFAEKVQSFSRRESIVLAPVCAGSVLRWLREEIENHVGHPLGLTIEAPRDLPKALAEPASLQYAALFAIEAMLQRDVTARRLVLIARNGFADVDEDDNDDEVGEADPQIQMVFELHGHPRSPGELDPRVGDAFQLTWVAAKNLVEALRGDLTLSESPGNVTTATLTLRAASATRIPRAETAPRPVSARGVDVPHAFSGALIVEADPSVRELLAEEIDRTGRKPVALGDTPSARALFECTPERFELLVIATETHVSPNELFAALALMRNPHLQVILAGPDGRAVDRLPESLRARTRFLRKPFGALEVRDLLACLEDLRTPTPEHAATTPLPALEYPNSREP